MAIRGHPVRWVVYIIFNCVITKWETSTQPVYTSATGNGNDALIVSNEQVYLQLGQTQRVPCGKQTGVSTDFIAATWYKGNNKKEDVIRIVSNPIYGDNYTSLEYGDRASFTQGFALTLRDIIQGDAGRYTCEIITTGGKVDDEVEVVVIDKTLPKRSAVRSVSQLLQAGENVIHCPVYNKSITRPTLYYSIENDIRYPTDILVSRFSDGYVLSKDSTFDLQREANYSLVIKEPDAVPAELLIWCHVSSDVDGVNLMSGFINVTRQYIEPAEPLNLVWIVPLVVVVVVILIIIGVAIACYKWRWSPQQLPPLKSPTTTTEEMALINQGPINNESCQDYKLKKVIQKGGKKGTASKDNFFSSLRLVAVTGDGDLVTLDNDTLRVMSKKYEKKVTIQNMASPGDCVAIATSKRHTGEVLVARKSGKKISWLNISDGKEVEIDGSRTQTPGEITDMAVDDKGTIYVADNIRIYTYNLNGSFKLLFIVTDSPKCISASGDGIVYVLCIDGSTIKRFNGNNGKRDDYDIKCPTDVNFVTTGLYSSKTSVYALTKKAGSEEEASAILEFSAEDGKFKRRIIDDWPGILGMVFIRGDDELAFFDSKEVKVYERQKPKKGGKEISL